MPSYIHICEGCGAALTVHERYFGRRLRCTSCREPFLSVPPELAEEPAPPQPPPPPVTPGFGSTSGRRRDAVDRATARKRWLIGGVVAVVFCAGIFWLGLPKDDSVLSPLFDRQVFRGRILEVADGGVRYAAIESDAAADLVATVGQPAARLNALQDDPRFITLAPGTTVRVMEDRKREHVLVLRVLDGPWADRKVWMPRAWVR